MFCFAFKSISLRKDPQGFPSLARGYTAQKGCMVWGVALWGRRAEEVCKLYVISLLPGESGAGHSAAMESVRLSSSAAPLPRWAAVSCLWASCSPEPPWDTLHLPHSLAGARAAFPRNAQTKSALPIFTARQGVFAVLRITTTAFLVEQNDKGTSRGPRDARRAPRTAWISWRTDASEMLWTRQFLITSEHGSCVCPAGWTPLIWYGRGSGINIHIHKDSFNLVLCLG